MNDDRDDLTGALEAAAGREPIGDPPPDEGPDDDDDDDEDGC
jgi:hypothetical protein